MAKQFVGEHRVPKGSDAEVIRQGCVFLIGTKTHDERLNVNADVRQRTEFLLPLRTIHRLTKWADSDQQDPRKGAWRVAQRQGLIEYGCVVRLVSFSDRSVG